MALIQKYYS